MTFFTTAPLEAGNPIFLGRSQELTLLGYICRDAAMPYAVVYGGRQNGKTSLLLNLLPIFQPPVYACMVNFARIPGATTEGMLAFLAERIGTVAPPGQPADTISDVRLLKEYLLTILARPDVERLIVILDEPGGLSYEAQAALAAALRSFLDERATLPPLRKFQAILSGGGELYEMVFDKAAPLYTRCTFQYLGDLPPLPGIGLLADGLRAAGVETTLSAAIGRAVYTTILLGHPYLTQRMGELLTSYHFGGTVLDKRVIEQAAVKMLADTSPFLQHVLADLQYYHLDRTVEEFLHDQNQTQRNTEAMRRLELIGLLKHVAGNWLWRNSLLTEWIYTRLNVPMPATLRRSARWDI